MRPSPALPRLALLAAIVALPLAAYSLPARADTALPAARITVTGEGRVDAVPDLATISLGVTTEAKSAAEALAANNAAMAAVLERLRAAGVADRDLQTTGLSVNPVWSGYERSGGRPEITGFQAANVLTVRVRALDTLRGVLDAAVKDGANTLNGLAFGLAEPQPALDEARARAVADARRKAELMAAAAGVTLGRIDSITEGGGGAPYPQFRAESAMVADAVPVAQGEVSLSASVTVVWRLAE
ncbi:MAG TPA: SIMPL domain-containing protein [Paracoccaceae bacterium]|nr:SIMPL domain-containing protein [Paracoccaceae bacterium]